MKVGHTAYLNEDTNLVFSHYAEGGIAIQLVCEDGEPAATATVNLPIKPSPQCVWLKDWSENEGMVEALIKAGVVTITGRTAATGYVEAIEARLTSKAMAAYKEQFPQRLDS